MFVDCVTLVIHTIKGAIYLVPGMLGLVSARHALVLYKTARYWIYIP